MCLQNHDQIGNRAYGERLHHQIDHAAYRAASVLLCMLPHTPLLFMGQEWAASSPFRYFTDHHAELGRLVTEGRRREFAAFAAFTDSAAREAIPDPQAPGTFDASRLDWAERAVPPHDSMLRLYTQLLHFRRNALSPGSREDAASSVALDAHTIALRRRAGDGRPVLIVARLRGAGAVDLEPLLPPATRPWVIELTSEDAAFAPEGRRPELHRSGETLLIRFAGPAGVILRPDAGTPEGAS
jgi:maltooligosyltrehalose trehalohydrolase